MSKRSIYFLCMISSIIFIYISCGNKNSTNIRVSIISKDGSDATVKVYPENELGEIINGAVVISKNSSGIMTFLDFSNENQCYKGSLSSNNKDEFEIILKSNAFEEIYTVKIPHEQPDSKPVISNFLDSEGNNVLNGDSLSSEQPIQIAWSLCGDDVCYQIQIKTSLTTVWTCSSYLPTITVPQGVLEAGTYYVSIIAQKKFGDEYFQTQDYFSASSIQSSTVMFYVE